MLECRKYNEQREKLRKEVGLGKMRIEKQLGYPELIKHLIEYVATIKGKEI